MPELLVASTTPVDPRIRAEGQQLAVTLGVAFVEAPLGAADPAARKAWLAAITPRPAVVVFHDGEAWTLLDAGKPESEPVRAGVARTNPVGRSSPLGRALGVHKRVADGLTVLDATGGLGRDALTMSRWGCHVTLIERSAVMALLLADAHRRDPSSIPAVIHAEATAVIAALPDGARPDVIYLDPMHPPRRKAAEVKHDLAVLGKLLGDQRHDVSAEQRLWEVACECARHRVVVKRPPHAPPLGAAPAHSVNSTRVRFDVYLT